MAGAFGSSSSWGWNIFSGSPKKTATASSSTTHTTSAFHLRQALSKTSQPWSSAQVAALTESPELRKKTIGFPVPQEIGHALSVKPMPKMLRSIFLQEAGLVDASAMSSSASKENRAPGVGIEDCTLYSPKQASNAATPTRRSTEEPLLSGTASNAQGRSRRGKANIFRNCNARQISDTERLDLSHNSPKVATPDPSPARITSDTIGVTDSSIAYDVPFDKTKSKSLAEGQSCIKLPKLQSKNTMVNQGAKPDSSTPNRKRSAESEFGLHQNSTSKRHRSTLDPKQYLRSTPATSQSLPTREKTANRSADAAATTSGKGSTNGGVSVSKHTENSAAATKRIAATVMQTETTSSESLTTAPSGRNYWMWDFGSGLESTRGTVFPDDYEQHSDPENSWICPIRSCRRLYSNLTSLGGHFNAAHSTCILNDNLDGTLTIVVHTATRGKPRVVSRRPLGANEPPMVQPGYSAYAMKLSGALPTATVIQSPAEKRTKLDKPNIDAPMAAISQPNHKKQSSVLVEGDAKKLWAHIQSYLDKFKGDVPQIGYYSVSIAELLKLPRIRDLLFNAKAKHQFFDSMIQDVVAMLIHLTGPKAKECCKQCRESRGPFEGCVLLSEAAPEDLHTLVTGCANCYYKGAQRRCDFWQRTEQKGISAALRNLQQVLPSSSQAEQTSADAKQKSVNVDEKRQSPAKGWQIAPESKKPAELKTWSSRNLFSAVTSGGLASTPTAPIQSDGISQDVVRTQASNGQLPSRNPRNVVRMLRSGEASSFSKEVTRPTLAKSGHNSDEPPELSLEMEEWEIAPGRIRSETSQRIENIAFSTAYLTHNQPVNVHRDIGFHNIVLKPGTMHRFDADPDKVRICSVASGKVWIKTQGQEHTIGPNGMFKINSSTVCTAQNRLYIDSTIMICAVSETSS